MIKFVRNLKVKKTIKLINEEYNKFVPNKRFDKFFVSSPTDWREHRYKINLDPDDSDKDFEEILVQYACNLPGNTTELAFSFGEFMLQNYSIQRNAIYFEKENLCWLIHECGSSDDEEGLYAFFNKDIILNPRARQVREDISKIIQFFNHFLNKEYYAMLDRKQNSTLNTLYNKR